MIFLNFSEHTLEEGNSSKSGTAKVIFRSVFNITVRLCIRILLCFAGHKLQ
jgi:hypothetical protein